MSEKDKKLYNDKATVFYREADALQVTLDNKDKGDGSSTAKPTPFRWPRQQQRQGDGSFRREAPTLNPPPASARPSARAFSARCSFQVFIDRLFTGGRAANRGV